MSAGQRAIPHLPQLPKVKEGATAEDVEHWRWLHKLYDALSHLNDNLGGTAFVPSGSGTGTSPSLQPEMVVFGQLEQQTDFRYKKTLEILEVPHVWLGAGLGAADQEPVKFNTENLLLAAPVGGAFENDHRWLYFTQDKQWTSVVVAEVTSIVSQDHVGRYQLIGLEVDDHGLHDGHLPFGTNAGVARQDDELRYYLPGTPDTDFRTGLYARAVHCETGTTSIAPLYLWNWENNAPAKCTQVSPYSQGSVYSDGYYIYYVDVAGVEHRLATLSGSGTAGRVAWWGPVDDELNSSAKFLYDDATATLQLGISTTARLGIDVAPTAHLHVHGSGGAGYGAIKIGQGRLATPEEGVLEYERGDPVSLWFTTDTGRYSVLMSDQDPGHGSVNSAAVGKADDTQLTYWTGVHTVDGDPSLVYNYSAYLLALSGSQASASVPVGLSIANTATSTGSLAAIALSANTATVLGLAMVDGLGTGPYSVAALVFGTETNHPIQIIQNNAEVARFTTYGRFAINATTALSTFTLVHGANVTNIGGTVTADSSFSITCSGSGFLSTLGQGDRIEASGFLGHLSTVQTVTSNTVLILDRDLGATPGDTINVRRSTARFSGSSHTLVMNDLGHVSLGAVITPGLWSGGITAGTSCLSMLGANIVPDDYGLLELGATGSDGVGTMFGAINWVWTAASARSDRRMATIRCYSEGSASTDRGGVMELLTKSDGGALSTAVTIDSSRRVAIGGTVVTSALLTLSSTSGALLIPRLTTTQITTLTGISATNGMLLYDSTVDKFKVREAGAWVTYGVSGATGTVTSIDAGTPSTQTGSSGLTFSASPITTTGTIALASTIPSTITWNGVKIGLAYGGTNADLSASNGGIFYSTASAAAILAGTATARQMLQSGASTTPAWSNSTWPASAATGDVLYGSGTNVWSQLAASTDGFVLTLASGVPSWAASSSGLSGLTTNGVVYATSSTTVTSTAQGAANTVLTANAGAPAFSASPTIGTSVTTPLLIGGTTTTSTLTLKTTTGVGTTNADMIFVVGNNGATEAMRILNNARVGIGTNAPGEVLHVNGGILSGDAIAGFGFPQGAGIYTATRSAASGGYYMGQDSTHYASAIWNYNATANNAKFDIGTNNSTNELRLQTNNGPITAGTGKFGIGRTATTYKLELAGDFYATSASSFGIVLDATGAANVADIEFYKSAVFKCLVGMSGSASGLIAGSVSGDLCIRGNSQKILFSTDNGTTAHTVMSGALVGVGRTPTTYKLEVAGDIYGTSSSNFGLALDGTSTNNTEIDFLRSGSGKGLIGIAGAANGLITGTSANDMVFRTASQKQLWSNDSGTTAHLVMTAAGHVQHGARHETAKGANVASGTTLTLGADGNYFFITGTTTIKGIITASWQAGSRITLDFTGAPGPQVNHADGSPGAGAVALLLSGSANLTTTTRTRLALIYDGTNWVETARTVQ